MQLTSQSNRSDGKEKRGESHACSGDQEKQVTGLGRNESDAFARCTIKEPTHQMRDGYRTDDVCYHAAYTERQEAQSDLDDAAFLIASPEQGHPEDDAV